MTCNLPTWNLWTQLDTENMLWHNNNTKLAPTICYHSSVTKSSACTQMRTSQGTVWAYLFSCRRGGHLLISSAWIHHPSHCLSALRLASESCAASSLARSGKGVFAQATDLDEQVGSSRGKCKTPTCKHWWWIKSWKRILAQRPELLEWRSCDVVVLGLHERMWFGNPGWAMLDMELHWQSCYLVWVAEYLTTKTQQWGLLMQMLAVHVSQKLCVCVCYLLQCMCKWQLLSGFMPMGAVFGNNPLYTQKCNCCNGSTMPLLHL